MTLLARVPLLSRSRANTRDHGAGQLLPFALLISLLLHAVVLSIHFSKPATPPQRQQAQQLEVVLVNAKRERAPDTADVLAQANLDGGGTSSEEARPSTPTPPRQQDAPGDALADAQSAAPAPAAASDLPESTAPESAAAPAAPSEPAPVLTNPDRPARAPAPAEKPQSETSPEPPSTTKPATAPAPKPAPKAPPAPTPEPDAAPKPAPRSLSGLDLQDSVAAIARLEAQIDRRLDEFSKRPRKVQIGARAREHRFAQYAEDWRQKVERIGTLNYPEAARGQTYGTLVLTVAIRADGTVERVEVDRSSGHDVLDKAAVNIVRMAAPYAPFPPDIRSDTDIIEITRTWSFTNSNQLRTR